MLAVTSIRPSTSCAAKASAPTCLRAYGRLVRNFGSSSTPISAPFTPSIAAPTRSSVRSHLFSSSQAFQRQQQQQRRSMAKMMIIGRVTGVPEAITTNNGRECVRYTIAKGHGKNSTPSFFRVMMFDEGEGKEQLLGLPKGSLVFVEATAKLRTYTDDRDGTSKTSLGLIQKNLQILLRHRTAEERENQQVQQHDKEQQERFNNDLMMDPQGDGGDGESGGESDSAEGEVYDRAPRSSSSG